MDARVAPRLLSLRTMRRPWPRNLVSFSRDKWHVYRLLLDEWRIAEEVVKQLRV